MRTEVIKADTVDQAVERILRELKEDNSSSSRRRKRNVIYFDGWDGLGASAVLRAVGRRLTTPAASQEKESGDPTATVGMEFSLIFHIDCSKWESRRSMQRVIAEQLKLPASVLDVLDAQDEDDDYKGVSKGSRTEIPQVAEAINQHILKLATNRRFMVIFYNGSSEEIDLGSLGFPLLDRYSRNKVLWSFQGRFRFYPRTKVDRALKNTRATDVFLSADSSDMGEDKLCDILGHEAEDVARKIINAGGINWPEAATSYFLYTMNLYGMGNHINDYDMQTHACNYWRCDGNIQALQQRDIGIDDSVDKLWLSSDTLHHEIQLDEDYYQYISSPVQRSLHKNKAYWTSPTDGFMLIPDLQGKIPKGMFHQFDKLRVLKLSACAFSFKSPPFLCCHNLKFLWLDRCRDGSSINEEVKEDTNQFFQRLWVLDVRYSNKTFLSKEMMDVMTQLRELNVFGDEKLWHVNLEQSKLHNIHRLRIKEANVSSSFLFSGIDKMELLELSRNYTTLQVFVDGKNYTAQVSNNISVKSCRSLETFIINGFDYLTEISLSRCAKLKNILLSGSLKRLCKIHIIGAGVETLDFSKVTTRDLDELYLLDCVKLCAILWPPAYEDRKKRYLDRLRIGTTQKEGSTEHTTGEAPGECDWHFSVRDARILQSLESIKDYFGSNHAHMEISSPSHHPYADDAGSKDDRMKSSNTQLVPEKQKQLIKDTAIYADVTVTLKDINKQHKQANEGDTDAPMIMCICPPRPSVPSQGCYIHIEDQTRTKLQATSTTIPAFICDSAKILHMHDSLHITNIVAAPLASATWNQLEWCRVEWCPKLGCVFSPQLDEGPEGSYNEMFKELRTFWASHLPKARHIWKWNGSSGSWYNGGTFVNLTFFHLDYCSRVINIIHFPMVDNAFDKLETLEIMWCGELSVAFHFYGTLGMSVSYFRTWIFNKLKHVRLHELPQLQSICNTNLGVEMPKLETIKIRGCWSLRRLPIVTSNIVVKCDCEKEWWDRLEWESAEHASKYKPMHPRHYKKTMLKGSVLR